MTSTRNKLIATVLLVLCMSGATARADPLTFHDTTFLLSATGPIRVDLFANPGIVLATQNYLGRTIPRESLIFGTNVDPHGTELFTDTIQFTFHEEGAPPLRQSSTFTTSKDAPRLGVAALFTPVRRTGQPVPATLTVELLNSAPDFVIPGGPNAGRSVDSFTYSFQVVSPTPEPATMGLFGFGAIVLLASKQRRRRTRTIPSWCRK